MESFIDQIETRFSVLGAQVFQMNQGIDSDDQSQDFHESVHKHVTNVARNLEAEVHRKFGNQHGDLPYQGCLVPPSPIIGIHGGFFQS
jgi:hypothetical protein